MCFPEKKSRARPLKTIPSWWFLVSTTLKNMSQNENLPQFSGRKNLKSPVMCIFWSLKMGLQSSLLHCRGENGTLIFLRWSCEKEGASSIFDQMVWCAHRNNFFNSLFLVSIGNNECFLRWHFEHFQRFSLSIKNKTPNNKHLLTPFVPSPKGRSSRWDVFFFKANEAANRSEGTKVFRIVGWDFSMHRITRMTKPGDQQVTLFGTCETRVDTVKHHVKRIQEDDVFW